MDFDEIEKYVQEIVALEFADRNHEIQIAITRTKGEMAARGITNSTITLNHFAEFFLAEFKARVDFVASHAVGSIGKLNKKKNHDLTTNGVALYKQIASQQFTFVEQTYDSSASMILASLQGNMPAQIRELLIQRMNNHMKKKELTVEFEYSAYQSMDTQEDIFLLQPNISGIGIDLKELWNRYMT
jgi:hypothetical protein